MADNMDIEQLVKQLELDYNVNISAKANKFKTRATEKLGNRMLSSLMFYYKLAFIELACQSLDEDFDRSTALELNNLDEKTYLKKLSESRYVLHQDAEVLISYFTEEFKCGCIYHEIHALLDDMKTSYDEPEAVTSPVFVGAGFYLTATQFGYQIDKQKVMDEVCATNFEFKQVTEHFNDFAGETLNFFSQMKLQNTKRGINSLESDNSYDEGGSDDFMPSNRPENVVPKKKKTKKENDIPPSNINIQESKPVNCVSIPTKERPKPLKQLRLVAVKLATLKNPITTSASAEKTVFEPLNAVTAMANDTYFRETQDYREYLVWKRNLIAKLRRNM
ncbi:Origin of replication complex subunit 6 [Basidiobolus ranarum]|uniref:Origin of replication complex subunit 6 n=1 Tax=Basidiobolus ranarum TaxID=34480 RepID=A0ABR2WJ62_9FUNG